MPDGHKGPPPPSYGAPHIFGWQHLVFLFLGLTIAIVSLILINRKVKDVKIQDIIVRSVGGLLLAAIIWNRISLIWFYDSAWALIPNTFCGTTSLTFGICAIFCKRNHLVLHYFIYAGFWGGIISTIYPTFIGQNLYFSYPPTLSGMIHHFISLYLAVLMVMTGFVKPSLNKFYAFPVGFIFILAYGIFLMDALHFSEAMYIFAPLVSGTFLTWYVVGPAMVGASLLALFLYEKVIKKKPEQRQLKKQEM